MSDDNRPRSKDGDYDWLYDVSSKGVGSTGKPSGEPEPTQVLPTGSLRQPPPSARHPDPAKAYAAGAATRPVSARPPGGSGGNQPPPTRNRPGGPPAKPPKPPRRKGRLVLLTIGGLLVAWVAYLVLVPLLAWTSVSRVNASPKAGRPAEQPGTTYLVVGSDARKGLQGRRTDTIMLLHTGSGPNTLVSLPRDSLVEVPGHGVTKINAAFAYGGPRLLVRTVEGATGIRVDDYVEIGFNGFKNVVDAVGGITICPKQAVRDKLAHINIGKGCQEVDGPTALGYARSRHAFALGDIARAQHQREVVSAIGSEVLTPATFLNPFRYWKVVHAAADSVRVGEDTGVVGAAKFAQAMTKVDGANGLTCSVPISDLAVHWDTDRANRLFRLIREDRTQEIGKAICRPDGLAR